MAKAYGKKVWLIPDGFLHSVSLNDQVSHEAVCVLNTSDKDAKITLTLYFEDRDVMTGFTAECKAGRTHHIRLDRMVSENGEKIPTFREYLTEVMKQNRTKLIAECIA